MLKFEKVFYIKDSKKILNNISFDFEEGDFVNIIGPSGSGKSTLLKLCCHLISATSGSIFYEGKDLLSLQPTEIRKSVSYSFQTPYLFGDTVRDNLSLPYSLRSKKFDEINAIRLLNTYNLDDSFINKRVKELSGGEKQRIALIRSIIVKPRVLLLDEVTSSLDEENRRLVEDASKRLNREGTTILWVTHNMDQLKRVGNKVLTLENGEVKALEVIS